MLQRPMTAAVTKKPTGMSVQSTNQSSYDQQTIQSNGPIRHPQLGEGVPTQEDLEKKYGFGTEQLCNDHEQIIESILQEEETLISTHRTHIDEVVSIVKDEMAYLNEVD